MAGAGKLLWGLYPGPPAVWVPLQVDVDGKVIVDMSAIGLNDLADVSVATPADDDLFYYDDATSLWKARKLVDADIPAGIARDAEVAAAIADHADDKTGIHGVGARYVAETSVEDLDLGAHVSRHGVSGADPIPAIFLADIVAAANFIMIPTNAGYAESNLLTGSISQDPMRLVAITGTTANSRALAWTPAYGFNEGAGYQYMNWDKSLVLIYNVARYQSDVQAVGRVQLKPAATEGALADKGIGLKILNGALWGESYGTALGEVDLSYTLNIAVQEGSQIKIVLDPGTSIKWYVNGVLKGTQSTATTIPSGTAIARLVFSLINGATGGVNLALSMMQAKIWQER